MNISKITSAPWNTRDAITDESVRSLAESIKADGLIQPISVCDNEAGDGYICFDGNRRLAACKLLGLEEIPTNYHAISIDEAVVDGIVANHLREDDDPLRVAGNVDALVKKGWDLKRIAARAGESVAWVKRQTKLCALCEEVRNLANKVDLKVLERVSDLDPKQQAKFAKNITGILRWANGNTVKWSDVRSCFTALTFDLDDAKFDTAACLNCTERTGTEWFAEDGTKLGRCVNCACFEKREAERKAKLVSDAIPDGVEREELMYDWQMPNEVKCDSSKKRDKKHPCAYYVFNTDGDIEVTWGKSREAINAEREAAEQEREAERAARSADYERNRDISSKINDWLNSDEGEAELRRRVAGHLNPDWSATDFIISAFVEWAQGIYSDADFARLMQAFDGVANLADIGDEDAKWFIDRNTDDDDAGDDED